MYQGWTTEIYRSTSKDEENRVKEGSREEENKAVEKGQRKEGGIQILMKIMSLPQQKKKDRT